MSEKKTCSLHSAPLKRCVAALICMDADSCWNGRRTKTAWRPSGNELQNITMEVSFELCHR